LGTRNAFNDALHHITEEIYLKEEKKMKAFLALGVKSCWLVMPVIEVINIYSPNHRETFDMNDTELVDKIMDIHLPIQKNIQPA